MPQLPSMENIVDHMGTFLFVNPVVVRNLEVCIATQLTRRTTLPRLWLMIIGSPSVGKSLVLDLFEGLSDTFYMDDATGNALVSGFREDGGGIEDKEKNYSIARAMNMKSVIMSDMTLAITKGDASSTLMSQLRLLYDGRLNKGYGNQGMVDIKANFNILGGCTYAIDKVLADQSLLGERFLYIKCPDFTNEESFEITQRKLEVHSEGASHMRELRRLLGVMLDVNTGIKPRVPTTNKEQRRLLGRLGMFIAFCRSSPIRDSRGNIVVNGQLEQPARVVEQLLSLCSGVAMCYGRQEVSDYDIDVAKHAALSSMPSIRRSFVTLFHNNTITGNKKGFIKKDIERIFRMKAIDVTRLVETMHQLDVIKENNHRWHMSETLQKYVTDADMSHTLLNERG